VLPGDHSELGQANRAGLSPGRGAVSMEEDMTSGGAD
jgi:hypothetical protein